MFAAYCNCLFAAASSTYLEIFLDFDQLICCVLQNPHSRLKFVSFLSLYRPNKLVQQRKLLAEGNEIIRSDAPHRRHQI